MPALVTGIFDDHVGGKPAEFFGLLHNRTTVAVKTWISLDGEPAIAATLRVEHRSEQSRGSDRQFADELPTDLLLAGRWPIRHQRPNPLLPLTHLLFQHPQRNYGIAGGAYRPVLNRVGKFLRGS